MRAFLDVSRGTLPRVEAGVVPRETSPQWALRRDTNAPGPPFIEHRGTLQHRETVIAADDLDRVEPELRQCVGGPAAGRWVRRFTHDEPATRLEESDRALRRHRGWTKRPGHDHREALSQIGAPGGSFGPRAQNVDAVKQSECVERLAEELCPARRSVDQHGPRPRPFHREYETRKSAPGAEIEERARYALETPREAPRVRDLRLQRAGPEVTAAARLSQYVEERRVALW